MSSTGHPLACKQLTPITLKEERTIEHCKPSILNVRATGVTLNGKQHPSSSQHKPPLNAYLNPLPK